MSDTTDCIRYINTGTALNPTWTKVGGRVPGVPKGTYVSRVEASRTGEFMHGDPHLLLYPLSTTEGAVRGPTATNFSFYRNARLDDLLIRASQISFRPERLRVYGRAQAFLAEEIPWIPLYVRLHWAVVRPEVRNFRLHPSGNHRLDRAWIESPQPPPPPAPPRMP